MNFVAEKKSNICLKFKVVALKRINVKTGEELKTTDICRKK